MNIRTFEVLAPTISSTTNAETAIIRFIENEIDSKVRSALAFQYDKECRILSVDCARQIPGPGRMAQVTDEHQFRIRGGDTIEQSRHRLSVKDARYHPEDNSDEWVFPTSVSHYDSSFRNAIKEASCRINLSSEDHDCISTSNDHVS